LLFTLSYDAGSFLEKMELIP